MVYRDMPLPNRRAPRPKPASGDPPRSGQSAPPGFRARLELSSDGGHLTLSCEAGGTSVIYRGRGYFTENPSDLPGSGFRAASFSLLDPFLTDCSVIPARHYKLVLRAILPKLRHDGLPVECGLVMTDEVPVQVSLARTDAGCTLTLFSCVPPDSLRAVPGLSGFMLSGSTLYRIVPAHLDALAGFSDGELLSETQLAHLSRLCTAAEYLFSASAVSLLREHRRRAAAPGYPLPPPRPSVCAESSARREVALPGPAVLRAVLLPSPLPGSVKTAVFLNDARRLRGVSRDRASFTGFRAGRPTYADMNAAQRSWYFYWRTELFRGNLLPTDISYIYVAAYELLNSVTASGAEALEQLLRLWEGYRETFPYLDRCMPGWCADYMLLHDLGTDFDALSQRIPFSVTRTDLPPELFISGRLGQSLCELPLAVLGELSGYDILGSRFCADESRRAACAEAVRTALRAAEEACLRGGEPLADCALPVITLPHDSFTGAVVGRALQRRIELVCRPFSRDEAFCTRLAGILRCTENCLRRRMHFPGRLREDSLPPLLTEAVRHALEGSGDSAAAASSPAAPQEKPAPIVIDLERARALEDASWENTRLLLEALGDAPDSAADSGDAPDEPAPAAPAKLSSAPADASADAPADAPAEPEDWHAALAGRLTDTQSRVLRALLDGRAGEVGAICQAAMTFPAAVYEEINELALDTLGDLLIDTASGTIFEEYAEDLFL